MTARRSTLAALVRATRPLAHGNIAPPILYGQALAFALTHHFSWTALVLAQAFGVVDHLLIVFANDYADREADVLQTSPTPFSGGSRVLPDGELSPSTIRSLAIGAAIALLVLSMFISVWLGLAAIALIGAYSYPPLRLSYRGGGELLQGLGVGVVLPLVGLTAQGATIDARVISYLAPTFVLGVAGNVLTSLPDEEPDRAARKRSPAARWGGRSARGISMGLHAIGIALGWALLPLGPVATLVCVVAVVPQVAARKRLDPSATLAFVVLGGLTETIAIVGWSIALVLT